ncbi:hypothetical protein L1276_000926 [Flavobacterium sp. HSC-32F16]|uniref:hypothetical protein n=1 Tax=Flavobacterium sp. HSC-32F16 TaxID=2910964 RepID=UPI0020A405AA|nr:hypothetical protein [Flavobacterium sp. HSC-32F16]MCP2025786.1 hypothetical protein [Flavobacterium sp. HSC-32F16]
MKLLLDLDEFAKTLTNKGYDGFFLTQEGYPDKVKDSINRFLEACRNGTDRPLHDNLLSLNTYLEWNGEDKEKVGCRMWVKFEDDKFDIQKIEIERKGRYGHLIKKSELTNLTTSSVPTAKEALAKVTDKPEQQLSFRKKGFRL